MPPLRRVALLLAVLLWGNTFGPAQAQTGGPFIFVHTIETGPSNFPNSAVPGLKLTATLSLLEADGSVIRTRIKEGEAKLLLGDQQYRGDFGVLPPDWSVVVLVDTSGTLGNASALNDFRAARDSLSRSLQNVPDNTNLGLVTFGDRAPTVQELIKDREGLSKNIARLQASARGSACLNDGLYEAVNKLTGIQGRKAVFAFTASADNCNTRPLQQVLDAARQNGVQLYAVGLEGYAVSQADLDTFTRPTGGLGVMTSLSRLGPTLDNWVALLSNQWQVVWTLCPPQGEQNATLNLMLEDTQTLSTPLSFASDQAYACPPRVEVLGMEAATRATVRFNINISNREAVSSLEAQIVNRDTGRAVITQSLADFSDAIALPAGDLQKDADYELTLTALNANGQVLDTTDEPFQFRYQPVAPELKIAAVEAPTLERADFVITTTVQNPADFDIQYYKAWLVSEQDNSLVKGAEATVPVGQPILIPGEAVTTGDYLVMAQALDSAGQPQAEAQPFKVAYQQPSALDRLIFQLRQWQWAIAGLGALGIVSIMGLAVLIWVLVPKRGRVKTVEMALPEKARRTAAVAPAVESPPAPPASAKPAPSAASARPAAPPAPAKPAPSPEPAKPTPPPASAKPAPPPTLAKPTPAPAPAAPPAGPAPSKAAAPQPQPAPDQAGSQRTILALPHATLNLIEPATLTFSAVITKTPFTVGRREGSDAVLPVEYTSGVSGEHVTIFFASGLWYAQDDKSSYGTTLNGQPIPTGQRVQIEDGAVLGLGPMVKVQFRATRR